MSVAASKLTGKLIASDDPSGVLRFVADMPKARRRKPRAPALLEEAPPPEPLLDDVERVECLVKASDAARRELPRRVRVGASGRVVTQAELLSKLLDAEEIRSEVASGRRQRVKRCACGAMFEISIKASRIPEKCQACRGMFCRCGQPKWPSALSCKACAATPDGVYERKARRSERSRAAASRMTPEQRAARVAKQCAALPTERRSRITKAAYAAMSEEQRKGMAKSKQDRLTDEARAETSRKISEALRKSWETRRAKAAAAKP
jgi:hypothetical protein